MKCYIALNRDSCFLKPDSSAKVEKFGLQPIRGTLTYAK